MNLINNEKEKLIGFLKGAYEFKDMNNDVETYFEPYDDIPNMEEIGFQNIPQLKMMLQKKKKVIVSEQIDTLCAVAAFRNKPQKVKNNMVNNTAHTEVPDFIYNM